MRQPDIAAPAKAGASGYRRELFQTLWKYRAQRFGGQDHLFDRPFHPDLRRPPVFLKAAAGENVIARSHEKEAVLHEIPQGKRHRSFASLRSSQALAQSLFGNLKVMNKFDVLQALADEEGPIFPRAVEPSNVVLERPIRHLGEPRPTEVDVYFSGPERIAVECKLSEEEVGACSRPKLRGGDSQYCSGDYVRQCNREERCPLASIGVKYWEYVPKLFTWDTSRDQSPCDLREPYQLVRNVLAAAVLPDGSIDAEHARVVLVYDERNPSFQTNGAGAAAWKKTRAALRAPSLLRRCSWQQIVEALDEEAQLSWLAAGLREKYGFGPPEEQQW